MNNVRSTSLFGIVTVLLLAQTAVAAEPAAPVAPATPATESTASAATPVSTPDAQAAENSAQDARLKALEEQLARVKAELDAEQSAHPPVAPIAKPEAAPKPAASHWYDSIELSGYVQTQLEFHQDSDDQLAQGGQPLNQNRFLLRRGRLKVESKHRYTEFLLELDGNTVKGPAFGVQRAELGLVYRGADADSTHPALIGVTAGVLLPPFGRQLQESPRQRPFMERSLASRAFFPSEPDLGFNVSGTLGFFNYGVAVLNGEPAGQPVGFPLRDPNAAKDIMGRVGVAADVSSLISASGGVSLLNGTSTFRGTDGTKSVLTWTDVNEDGQISNAELTATPGSSPAKSSNFNHWAVGVDADVVVKTGLGKTELQGELAIANNLDRGLFISDPITLGHDERQLGYNVALTQDVTRHALLGVRYDYYDPRADVFTNKNGKVVPSSSSVKIISPLIGVRLPDRLKLLGQWDIERDHLATDSRGVPADRKNNAVTIRLQGEL